MAVKRRLTHYLQFLHLYLYSNSHRMKAIEVTICVLLIALPLGVLGKTNIAVTLSLGIVAAALSQSDEHWKSRLKSTTVMMIGFAISTSAVILLKPYPILFTVGFVFSTILFIIIGGINQQLRTISYGSILVGIYASLGYQPTVVWYTQSLLLCSGAFLFSCVAWFLLWRKPFRPIEENLAAGFLALSNFLDAKSKLFTHPDTRLTRNRLAELNIEVVIKMEQCREVLNGYGKYVQEKELIPYLQRYMLLQSLHERAASSHENHEELSKREDFKELLNGFAELLHQLGHATRLVSNELLTNQRYEHPVAIHWMIEALQNKLSQLPPTDLRTFDLLLHNLWRSHQSLLHLYEPEICTAAPRLQKEERTLWQRIREQLHFTHSRMRYAIRLSLCFVIGTIIVYVWKEPQTEWIPLTTLFVSQMSYQETKRRMNQRVIGTLTGIILGVLLLQLLPTTMGHLILLLASTFWFFYWLRINYAYAVVFITIYVLAASELSTFAGQDVLFPRIIDTLIGSFLAYGVTRLLWPDWQYKRLPSLLKEAIQANSDYFAQIVLQWKEKATDDLSYRTTRRKAHLTDNALTTARRSIQVEPRKEQNSVEKAITMTYLNHALLSHLSALGAHRDEECPTDRLAQAAIHTITESLTQLNNKAELERLNELLLQSIEELKQNIAHSTNPKMQPIYRLLYNILFAIQQLKKEFYK
ncbi:MAG: FUSC family membrane protein [Bacteroidaceae bacterium]